MTLPIEIYDEKTVRECDAVTALNKIMDASSR